MQMGVHVISVNVRSYYDAQGLYATGFFTRNTKNLHKLYLHLANLFNFIRQVSTVRVDK